MSMIKRRALFYESVDGIAAEQKLRQMAIDKMYYTAPSYSANSAIYPDNLIPFVDKHMNYLSTHPGTNPEYYIANLRLMTRIK